jgi:hypothetical protein
MDLQTFKSLHCRVDFDSGTDGFGRISLTIWRVWQFMTGWTEDELKEDESARKRWRSFLTWPPDTFALCAAVLGRSGSYSSALERKRNSEHRDASWAGIWLQDLSTRELDETCSESPFSKQLDHPWMDLWDCRSAPLSRIAECDELMEILIDVALAADRVSEGSGLPIKPVEPVKEFPASQANPGKEAAVRYRIIARGWQLLEPTRYGSSLCSKRIHPNAARVLPKMHVPQSGLTLRSLSHNLSFCESDEVQPRWFMIPGARGDVVNPTHMNLLILPWPLTIDPAQFKESASMYQSESSAYFDYNARPTANLPTVVEGFCDEAQRVLGSLDGVVMPELALTVPEYEAVRKRVLAKKLMLIAGVGLEASDGSRGSNDVCVDVPLSKHHAVHFRQAKHHRWKLDRNQIVTYGIGARLNPDQSYWENIDIGNRKLLFLVLRPWLVTSVLICEDLARHDPSGELLRSVGPHFVAALLMDGPQLSSRWPGRYAAALADDPGCSVVSVSSLGMVGLSRPNTTMERSRTIALWKDSRGGVKELVVPPDAEALAITISVDSIDEVNAVGMTHKTPSAVLTGVHPIKRQAQSIGPYLIPPEVTFLAPHEAVDLARLVQQQGWPERSPELLAGLTGEAKAIGWELWRLMTGFPSNDDLAKALEKNHEFAMLPEPRHTETAEEIYLWHATNLAGRARSPTNDKKLHAVFGGRQT